MGLPAVPAAAYAGTSPTGEAASAAATAEVTNLRVRWPGAKVRQGRRYVVKGKVSGGTRTLLVQRRIRGGWFPLGRARSAANGEFQIRVNTRWVARHRRIRVLAPASTTHDAAAVTRDGALTVTRNYRPRRGKAWKPIAGGPSKGRRWTPCGVKPGVITYRVNPKRLPRGGLSEIKRAIAKVTAATGFSLRYRGTTTHVPLKRGSSEISPDADLTIAYSTRARCPPSAAPVLPRPWQVMYPSPTRHDASYAKGDLRGLKKVGVAAGCFPGEAVGRVSPAHGRVLVTVHR